MGCPHLFPAALLADNDVIGTPTEASIYLDYPPVEYPRDKSLLWDVDAHYKETAGFPKSTYRNYSDHVNWAHEMVHAVNGQINRQHYSEGKTGYYVRRQ